MNTRNLMLVLSFAACASVIAPNLDCPSPARAETPSVTPMGQITAADEGRQVTVQGTVVGTENFSSGFKLHINDSTAQVVLVIWASDWDHIYSSYHLNVGAEVRATGKVDVYRNQIEVVPNWGSDVKVLKWAKREWRKYDLGAMNGNDHNAVVWFEGAIADITPAKDGGSIYLLIYNEQGAQKVRLYNVVADRVPSRDQLWIGQRVSVVGRVKAKRRVGIEIVPALPHDVYVMGAGDAEGEAK